MLGSNCDLYVAEGFVEQIFNDAARMTISIDRQLSVDAKVCAIII